MVSFSDVCMFAHNELLVTKSRAQITCQLVKKLIAKPKVEHEIVLSQKFKTSSFIWSDTYHSFVIWDSIVWERTCLQSIDNRQYPKEDPTFLHTFQYLTIVKIIFWSGFIPHNQSVSSIRFCGIALDRANRKIQTYLAGILLAGNREAVMVRASIVAETPCNPDNRRDGARYGTERVLTVPSGHSGNFHCPTPRPRSNRDLHTLSGLCMRSCASGCALTVCKGCLRGDGPFCAFAKR